MRVIELLAPCVIPSVIVQSVHKAKHGALIGHLDGLSKWATRRAERQYTAKPRLIAEQSEAASHENHIECRYAMFRCSKTCHSHTPSIVKLDREPTQVAFGLGCQPKTSVTDNSTANRIAIHHNACQLFIVSCRKVESNALFRLTTCL